MYGTMGVCCGIMRIGSRIVFPTLNRAFLGDDAGGVHSVSLTTDFCDKACASFGSYRDGPTLNTYPRVDPRHSIINGSVTAAARRDGAERIATITLMVNVPSAPRGVLIATFRLLQHQRGVWREKGFRLRVEFR
jgi:hypothetical protein